MQALLAPDVAVPPRRLLHLVGQAVAYQTQACLHHNTRSTLVSLMKEDPQIGISILASTFSHLHSLVEQLEQLKAQTGAQRVAEFLLKLCNSDTGACEVVLPYDKVLIAGSLGKIGRDISLLMQTEAGELFEPAAAGKGGSSTMPHKRNPVGAAVMIAAATRAPGLVATMLSAMPQEHERSLGLWHAEWETLPELCCLVSGSLQQALAVIPGLEVDARRMLYNLDLTHGLVLAEAVSIALSGRIGRDAAHHVVEQCCHLAVEQGKHLREVLSAEPEVTAQLSASALDSLLDPTHYLGQSKRWVKRAVADHQAFNLR